MTSESSDNQKTLSFEEFLWQASQVCPSKRQLDWFEMEWYAFMHFGVNTFTGREWGDGNEDPAVFAPTALDCDQWADVVKRAGMKGIILTAKHHDGFCLWPSRYTEDSVKNAGCRIDVVGETARACRQAGLRFGFYLSPWDRNSPLYGTDEYNDYFCNQLTELLTQYGDVFCVWFDNACGEGPNGKKQTYDFPRYIELVRKYQPDAVIFNDFGPDVRWCGNEEGRARGAEWSVVPSELCRYSQIQTGPGPLSENSDLSFLYNTMDDLGSLGLILGSKGLTFTPAEVDMSIRPGWFWHPEEEPHSLERLFATWLSSAGGNCCLNLNIPPDRQGRIDEKDVLRLMELRQRIDESMSVPIPAEMTGAGIEESKIPEDESGENLTAAESIATDKTILRIRTARPVSEIQYIVLREDLTKGQRVDSFAICAEGAGGFLQPLYEGRTVGNRRICRICIPAAWAAAADTTYELILRIFSSRGKVHWKSIEVFGYGEERSGGKA